jgi:hypothetical protein
MPCLALPVMYLAGWDVDGDACDALLTALIEVAAAAAFAESPLYALLLPRKRNAGARVFAANLFIRSAAFVRFSCLDVARRWRSLRRAAALLLKAAAAAASGELLPCCARIACILRRRQASSLLILLQMALSLSISLLPATKLLRHSDVSAGKLHARVRSSPCN